MKKTIKYLLLTVMLLTAVCLVASCSQWDTPYEDLDKDGYNVSVRFDANGGIFAGTNDVYIVDVFNLENAKDAGNGMKEISLLAPNDSKRGVGAFEISKTNSIFVGWYEKRELRVDEKGRALDAYGELTSVSGREQAYTYSGKWDFDKSVLTVDSNKEYKSEENALTLYAAWVPRFVFDIYAENREGGFDLIQSKEALELKLPAWNPKSGKMDINSLSSVDGKTFLEASLTKDFKEIISGTINGGIDYETATMVGGGRIEIYTRWLDGVWFNITSATQLKDNSRTDGNYIINSDLDFSDVTWSGTMASSTFKGQIIGNGHKISNITVNQGDTGIIRGGLFGGLDASAVIKDLTLENVTYNMNKGSLKAGASFGLLAGTIAEGATLENVAISGAFNVKSTIYPDTDYIIGVLSGNVIDTGIDISGITVNAVNDEDGDKVISLEINEENGQITVTLENKTVNN